MVCAPIPSTEACYLGLHLNKATGECSSCSSSSSSSALALIWAFLGEGPLSPLPLDSTCPSSSMNLQKRLPIRTALFQLYPFWRQLDTGDKLAQFYTKTEERCKCRNSRKSTEILFWFVCSEDFFNLEYHIHLKLSWVLKVGSMQILLVGPWIHIFLQEKIAIHE